jgi:preflagellin peptidase FlaK
LENESFWRKFLAFISGYKVQVAKLSKSVHLYPLEDITSKGAGDERKLLTLPKDENREEIVARISNAAEGGRIKNEVWATPGLPMLVFITAGLIVALAWGNLVWILLSTVWKI